MSGLNQSYGYYDPPVQNLDQEPSSIIEAWKVYAFQQQQRFEEEKRQILAEKAAIVYSNQLLLNERAAYMAALTDENALKKRKAEELLPKLNMLADHVESLAVKSTEASQSHTPPGVWKQSLGTAIETIQNYIRIVKPDWWANLFWFAQKDRKKQYRFFLKIKETLENFRAKEPNFKGLEQWFIPLREELGKKSTLNDVDLGAQIAHHLQKEFWIFSKDQSPFRWTKEMSAKLTETSAVLEQVRGGIQLVLQNGSALQENSNGSAKIATPTSFINGPLLYNNTPATPSAPPPYNLAMQPGVYSGSVPVWHTFSKSQGAEREVYEETTFPKS